MTEPVLAVEGLTKHIPVDRGIHRRAQAGGFVDVRAGGRQAEYIGGELHGRVALRAAPPMLYRISARLRTLWPTGIWAAGAGRGR